MKGARGVPRKGCEGGSQKRGRGGFPEKGARGGSHEGVGGASAWGPWGAWGVGSSWGSWVALRFTLGILVIHENTTWLGLLHGILVFHASLVAWKLRQ